MELQDTKQSSSYKKQLLTTQRGRKMKNTLKSLMMKRNNLQEAIRSEEWDAKVEEIRNRRSKNIINTHAQTLENLKKELVKLEEAIIRLQ